MFVTMGDNKGDVVFFKHVFFLFEMFGDVFGDGLEVLLPVFRGFEVGDSCVELLVLLVHFGDVDSFEGAHCCLGEEKEVWWKGWKKVNRGRKEKLRKN